MQELLRLLLRRVLMVVGIFALVLAGTVVNSTPKSFGLFNADHAIMVTDCLSEGDNSCGGLAASTDCSIHGGCVATGVLSAEPAIATVFGRDWTIASGATVADWADFPTNPPPITFL